MKKQAAFSKRWMNAWFILWVLVFVLLLAACGGGSAAKPDVSKADIGQTVNISNWQITLKGVPEFQKVVGASGVSHMARNGQYAIIPVDVTNTSTDIVLFPDDLVFLKDSNGQQWKAASSTPQFAYKQDHKEVDILMDSPVAGNETRKTVLIFDIPSDVSGLSLVFNGSDTIFKLGY